MLVQVTAIMLPGRQSLTIAVSASGEETGRPFADVITSPGAIPAVAAALPQSTASTRAPDRAGATTAGTGAAVIVA